MALYNRLKKLYGEKRLTEKGLENAVAKGWITEEEKTEIITGKGTGNGKQGE